MSVEYFPTIKDNVIVFPTARAMGLPRRLVPMKELQALYGFSERWWRYRLAEGLPAHRWSGGLRFDPIEVERWMEARNGA